MTSTARPALALAGAFALSACGAVPVDPTPVVRPTGEGELVIRVERIGGLRPPLDAERTLPVVSIYGDGLVLVPAPVPDVFPGPAGHDIEAFRIEPTLLDDIIRAAHATGLQGPDRRIEQEGPEFVADAGTTVVTVVSGGRRHVTTADALFDVEADSAPRRALADFVARLEQLRAAADEVSPYRPSAVAVFVAAVDEASVPDPSLLERVPWPFTDPLAEWGEAMPPDGLSVDVRCRVIEGDELELLDPGLQTSTAATVVVDGDEERIVAWRPLLPDESGC